MTPSPLETKLQELERLAKRVFCFFTWHKWGDLKEVWSNNFAFVAEKKCTRCGGKKRISRDLFGS